MQGIKAKLQRIPRAYLITAGLVLVFVFAAGAGTLIWQDEDIKALKETIRVYFSAEEDADRSTAWDELVALGSEDFQFLLWGLENNNALFMLERGKLQELFKQIEGGDGGVQQILEGCRRTLESEMTVGKSIAMDLLLIYKDEVTQEDLQDLQSILMNSEELAFVRRKAAATLAALHATGATDNLITVVTSAEEVAPQEGEEEPQTRAVPVDLREACLLALQEIDPSQIPELVQKLLEDKEAPLTLVKRALKCAAERRDRDLLITSLAAETTATRKTAIAEALVRIGETESQQAVRTALSTDSQGILLKTVLDTITTKRSAAGFEDIVQRALASEFKAVRLRAIRAARNAGMTGEARAEVERLG